MTSDVIKMRSGSNCFEIPNSWNLLTPDAFIPLCTDLNSFSKGEMSVGEVRLRYICRAMGIDTKKIRHTDALENLLSISEQVTFPFIIRYQDTSVFDFLPGDLRKDADRIDPTRLPSHYAKLLLRQNYRYLIDTCFCAQLAPRRIICDEEFTPFRINTDFGMLSTSLTALQFIEAREVLGKSDALPLLVSILCCPGRYSTELAQQRAAKLRKADIIWLNSVSLCFTAFVNYLFTKTPFSLLTKIQSDDHPHAITTGSLESLYGLCSEGYGSISEVENLNLLQYLTILRKKLIDSVRSLHGAKQEATAIEQSTGLPLSIIKKIIS